MHSVRKGRLEVRLANDPAEVIASQELRYRVFYDERGAEPMPEMTALGRDFDRYDEICDHLLVIDHDKGASADGVVGTYRLLRSEIARAHGGFYSADEYDLGRMLSAHDNHEILELGRSCVALAYRNSPTMNLLWQGIAAYVRDHDIRLMFGCASLPGTDPDALSESLSYLHHNHLAPADMRPVALERRYEAMAREPAGSIDCRRAIRALPPLIKGYLRLGGYVGDGAVVDHQFNTTDVCIVLPTEKVTDRYMRHYDRINRRDTAARVA